MASGFLQRVIIDTDPGVDDAQAILFAFRLGAFQIDAVTTVFGNCEVTTATRNARTLLELGKVDGVPVFVGAGEPLIERRLGFATSVHGPHGFGSFRPLSPRILCRKGMLPPRWRGSLPTTQAKSPFSPSDR